MRDALTQAGRPPHGQTREERDYYALTRRVYSVFAHVYDAVVFPFTRLRREVASAVVLPRGARLLDVATGTGAQAFAFADQASEVVGVDLSEAMLRVARRKKCHANVTFMQADATDLPFADESFDACCVSFALHEMPASVRGRVVGEMARVIKPGGSITLVDYGLPRGRLASALGFHLIKLYEPEHYASFVRSDWGALLERAGAEVVDDRPALHGFARILTGQRIAAGAPARRLNHEGRESDHGEAQASSQRAYDAPSGSA